LSFFLAYPVVILYAATTVRITPLNDRYLSPLVGPLILLLCVAFDGTRDYPRFSPQLRLMLKAIFGFGLVLMLLNGLFTEAQVPIEGEEGAGIVFMQKYDAPGSAQVFREVGMTLAEQELFSQAGGWFQRELELTPDSYDAHNQFGVVLMELGSFSQALIHFQRATQINPNRVEAYTNIGLCLIKEGQVDEAAEFFAGMIEMQPDNIPMYVNLGSVREGQEKFQEAIDLYREALRRRPDDETVRARLDSLVLRRGSE
jgi:tetratricopeptide (TPR) repeat protein